MYYTPAPPSSRPRSHSTGSPPKRTTIKIVMGKSYTRNSRALVEESKKQCQSMTSRYKTELCRPYQEYRMCKYGDKCQFAHGEHDLRIMPRHPKYKTELCRTYHSTGFCPYGPRCHFIHNMDEARQPDTPPGSPVKKTAGGFSSSMPISPSVDSGISSPDGYMGGCRSFEFPMIGGSGLDEGEERSRGLMKTMGYAAHLPPNCADSDLEASESAIHSDGSCSELFADSDLPSSSSSSSPFIHVGESFNVPSDPALDLQNLLMGLGIKDTPLVPPPSPRMSSLPPATLLPTGGSSVNSVRRLPVFDDMMNTKSDTSLFMGCSSDPGRRVSSSYPTFP